MSRANLLVILDCEALILYERPHSTRLLSLQRDRSFNQRRTPGRLCHLPWDFSKPRPPSFIQLLILSPPALGPTPDKHRGSEVAPQIGIAS